jgi:acyl carrier protein
MSPEEIESRVRAGLAEACKRDVASLSRDDDLVETLGLDSLQGLMALAVVEKRLGVRFADERLAELRTVRRIVDAIAASLERRTP